MSIVNKNALQTLLSPKYRNRMGAIITNSLNGLLIPLLNPLLTALVIRLASVELWGQFVNLMIVIQLGSHVISWGNKEFLLRAFSRSPALISSMWQRAFLARVTLLIGFAVLLSIWIHSPILWGLTVLWTVGLAWHQSLDVFVQYQKDFSFALITEMFALGLLVVGIFSIGNRLTLETLVLFFALTYITKAGIFTYRYRIYTLQKWHFFLPNLTYFQAALPFFLLGFSGMLQSRVDLYSVSYFFSEQEVGKYQVFINLMLYLQALANFILVPFVKDLYRLDYITIRKIAFRLLILGLVITPPVVIIFSFLLRWVFEIEFAPVFFVIGALYVLPSFFYLPVIYALFKAERQNIVLVMNLSGSLLALLINFLVLPSLGLLGAVVSVAIVHWGLFVVYGFQLRKLT